MNRSILPFVWHSVTVFLLVWFCVIGGFLLSEEGTPIVRFMLALCGSLCLAAGSRAGWIRPRLPKPSAGWVVGFLVCGMLTVIVLPGILLARDIARKSAMHSEMRIEGQRLLQYLEYHDGVLPPAIGGQSVYKYIALAEAKDGQGSFGRPFVWCADLSGLRLEEIPHPEKVVIAYSANPIGKYHGVLFLTGISYSRSKYQLDQLLRERPALIARAKQLKAKRESAHNSSAKSPL